MELNVTEENSKKIVFELKGEGHTLCNVLKKELWKNSHVKVATYTIKHPLIGVPTMTVETDGTVKPKKVLTDAAEKVLKNSEEFKKELKKLKW
ncbi:MAG: DNA-directed RNA polymerase subunit L [bacterium]|nr:DNA-directed RNA polymerase subunit L [bacterium]